MEDYKEKLRLAKEALDSGSYDKETIEYIFPELKESEDEKIRKSIIELVKQSSHILNSMNQKSMIAWLEKHGEQKPEIKYIYPKFRVGDVIEPLKPNGHYAPVRVKYIGEGNYSCESDDCKSFLSFPVCNENEYVLTKQNPLWSEEDEAMIDLLVSILEINHPDGYFKANQKDEVGIIAVPTKKIISWLKSLKERMKGE